MKINNFSITDDMEPIDQSHFLKEFDSILRITPHQNILNFLGVSQTADFMYLLFEDTPSTLKRRLVEARVPPNVDLNRFSSYSEEFILHILLEISMAFEYLTTHRVSIYFCESFTVVVYACEYIFLKTFNISILNVKQNSVSGAVA